MKKYETGCRFSALLLALAMLVGLLSISAAAAEPCSAAPESGTGWAENPLYSMHLEPELYGAEAGDSVSLAEEDNIEWHTMQEAAADLRDAMDARSTAFQLYICSEEKPDLNVVLKNAYSEEYAVSPTTGDYLKWSWSKMRWEYAETEKDSGKWVFRVYAAYYDTAEQEQEFRKALSALVKELNLWSKSDYQRYEAIYSYVTEHVTYDYAGLATHSDDYIGYDEEYRVNTYIDPNGDSDWLIYTAYDALCQGKAICQGYSTLMYALCRSYDLPIRIQYNTNPSNPSGGHSWNIGKLGELWYNLDSTWDSENTDYCSYFLKGSADFSDHKTNAELETEEYRAAYPISELSYEPTAEDYEPVMPFRDVPANAYYYAAVKELNSRGILYGTANNTFSPENTMTRAMAVAVLYRLAGRPETSAENRFIDVPAGAYYARAVTWAAEQGIVYGTTAETFSPDASVTRQQLMAILYRYAKKSGCDVSSLAPLDQYTDKDQIAPYAQTPFSWAAANGIIFGTTKTTLSPEGTATRCQVSAIIYRFIRHYGL